MCKLCDEIRPEGWNFCPICGKEINIPRYNLDDAFEDLLKRVGIKPKATWIADWPEEEIKEWYNNLKETK